MKETKIDQKTWALIGFALKSRQSVSGFEAVCREAKRGKIALVVVHPQISPNTQKKLNRVLQQLTIPVIKTSPDTDWKELWGMDQQKILGIRKGNIGRTLVSKFNLGV